MRLVALRMPTETFGSCCSNVRPTAMVHWPTTISWRGTSSGTTSGSSPATFSSTNMRLRSRATIWAVARLPLGNVTRMDDGCWMKLNALEMM